MHRYVSDLLQPTSPREAWPEAQVEPRQEARTLLADALGDVLDRCRLCLCALQHTAILAKYFRALITSQRFPCRIHVHDWQACNLHIHGAKVLGESAEEIARAIELEEIHLSQSYRSLYTFEPNNQFRLWCTIGLSAPTTCNPPNT